MCEVPVALKRQGWNFPFCEHCHPKVRDFLYTNLSKEDLSQVHNTILQKCEGKVRQDDCRIDAEDLFDKVRPVYKGRPENKRHVEDCRFKPEKISIIKEKINEESSVTAWLSNQYANPKMLKRRYLDIIDSRKKEQERATEHYRRSYTEMGEERYDSDDLIESIDKKRGIKRKILIGILVIRLKSQLKKKDPNFEKSLKLLGLFLFYSFEVNQRVVYRLLTGCITDQNEIENIANDLKKRCPDNSWCYFQFPNAIMLIVKTLQRR